MTQAIVEEMLRQIEHIGHADLKLRIISGMMLISSLFGHDTSVLHSALFKF